MFLIKTPLTRPNIDQFFLSQLGPKVRKRSSPWVYSLSRSRCDEIVLFTSAKERRGNTTNLFALVDSSHTQFLLDLSEQETRPRFELSDPRDSLSSRSRFSVVHSLQLYFSAHPSNVSRFRTYFPTEKGVYTVLGETLN